MRLTTMEGTRLLRTLRLTNFLSYGPNAEEIELEPLNVLIGPNGSGKSNFIHAISLLQAAPSDIGAPIRGGGGMPEWPWKGGGASPPVDLQVETTVSYPQGPMPLRYSFQLVRVAQGLELLKEAVENERPTESDGEAPCCFYSYDRGSAVLKVRENEDAPVGMCAGRSERHLGRRDLHPSKSILAQRTDPDRYPELGYLADEFSKVRLFRICQLGPRSALLGPLGADQPSGFPMEDGRNLGMVLNDLLNQLPVKRRILDELRRFYPYVEEISQRFVANTVETFFQEGYFATPSARLSDGTLRYLFLLTILCHPAPPRLVCIEDPEVALHPDALPRLAELLVEASERTQLVVTTHSDVLVSALSHM
ncbi:MAG: AAA family ATPase, partial [Planctomycetota bacterium]